ncbi:MAG: C1 family peptidase [Candidatus Marinimicrobia bacterium]|nr:C1 family peptidase [Candidatus Neomarinimicrobiota bacterium]
MLIAQEKTAGEISLQELDKIKKQANINEQTEAIINAVTNNSIRDLALNRKNVGTIDHLFDYKIEPPSITDQKSSGRCWLFTSLNVLRPKIVKKYNLEDFQFSESYLFFWDQFEKANLFLEHVIQTRDMDIDHRRVQHLFKRPIGDGGAWQMMPPIVEKYGVVPKQAMAETHNTENTRQMRSLLKTKLRQQGLKLRSYENKNSELLRKEKIRMLGDIYRILTICMGEPPAEFTWRYTEKDDSTITEKKYTPQEFYKEAVKPYLGNYVMLMDVPSKEYYKYYEIEWNRNRYDSKNWTFVNVPSEELAKFAKKSILYDEPMYFSCDVGAQLNRDAGLLDINNYDYESLLGVSFAMNKKERILSYESGSTHGMALIGLDTTETGEVQKWLLENSWGDEAGHKGYLTMTDEWFDEYSFRLVVKEEFLPRKIIRITTQEPILLPPWDRMQ